MRVFILKPDKTYYESIVFAIEYEFDKSDYIRNCWFYIMDENNKVIRINEYVQHTKYLYKQVFIRNVEPANRLSWIKEKTIEGYSKFIHNKEMLNKIKNGEPLEEDLQVEWEELNQGNLHYYESRFDRSDITDKQDIEDLIEFTMGFHDAHFEKIDKQDDKVVVELSGVWGFKVFRLIFSGNVSSFFEDYLEEIWFNGASIFIDKDGQICFADEESYSTKEEVVKDKLSYVFANSLKIEYEFDYSHIK